MQKINYIFSIHSSFVWSSLASLITKTAKNNYIINNYITKKKYCQCNCHGAQYVGTIDIKVTYDTNVITAVHKTNVPTSHDYRRTKAQFPRALHSDNPKLYMDFTTGTSNVRVSECLTLHS